ncbi:MAG: hypothetical protein ACOY71_14155 [Gemmatimonadota bacterium]
MGGYKVEQRRLNFRGREFHFVSYEGQVANPARGQPATPPTWFLMQSGKRWEVVPCLLGEEANELDQRLLGWLRRHAQSEP